MAGFRNPVPSGKPARAAGPRRSRLLIVALLTLACGAVALGLESGDRGSAVTPPQVTMPVGNIPGWHQVFADDFNGSALDRASWFAYSGQPGGDPGGLWKPSHVVVRNGQLVLKGYRDGSSFVTGGVSSQPALAQTYGKYLVRMRINKGQGLAWAALLWPASQQWPPEIDFGEDASASRSSSAATLHFQSGGQLQKHVAADFTKWQTIGVEWGPGLLRYTLNGKVWATVKTPDVPHVPMVLDLQTQAGVCTNMLGKYCPSNVSLGEIDMDIDWVVAYAPDRRTT